MRSLKRLRMRESSYYGYVEMSEKGIVNVTEECFAVGDVARCDCILVKLAGIGAFLTTQLK